MYLFVYSPWNQNHSYFRVSIVVVVILIIVVVVVIVVVVIFAVFSIVVLSVIGIFSLSISNEVPRSTNKKR